MSVDDRVRDALDRVFAEARPQLEREVRAIADELARDVAEQVAEERGRAAAGALDELRRAVEIEMAVLAATAHAFGEAQSLIEVLIALLEYAKRHASRVGIFLARHGGFEPWRLEGFDASTPPPSSAAIAAALSAGAVSSDTLTFPIVVGGKTVAVLHATGRPESGRPPALLDVLVCHASRTLESMTLNKTLGLMPLVTSIEGGVYPQ